MTKSAIFLDRDGVINKNRDDYVKNVSELEIFSFIHYPIKNLKELGFQIIVITNQSAINRGLTSHRNVKEIHDSINDFLKKNDTSIDYFYYCPHSPHENCLCRKPKPGLLFQAANELDIDLHSSWMIGDRDSDIIAGKSAGCKTIKIKSDMTLEDAVKILMESDTQI